MTTEVPQDTWPLTMAEIAEALGAKTRAVGWHIRDKEIKPVKTVGRNLLFAPEVVEQLRPHIRATTKPLKEILEKPSE